MCLRFAEKGQFTAASVSRSRIRAARTRSVLMFGVSAYSANIVIFDIDQIKGVPKINIYFFEQNRDSSSCVANQSEFRKLQAA
ncbi:unnamed protein product [Macrosiphum euphorbiae]|uniref:Uncharacterized protein n=1 Tax=Macrosiphum euphorbiae TaxID=13131 RepID=A0AAV0WMS3_9HEMI|nr:unnamed protein product [Macrosiphum euphorbiae]